MNNRIDNSLCLSGSRPASVAQRPESSAAIRSNTYHPIAPTSTVDETLFSSATKHKATSDPSSWTNKTQNKPSKPLMWSPPSHNLQSSTESPPKHRGMPGTRNKYRLVKHKDSYCDEMLFGYPLEQPKFAAPWEKKENKPKPLVFTGVDYTVNRTMGAGSARPQSGTGFRPASGLSSARSTKPSTPNKPVWR